MDLICLFVQDIHGQRGKIVAKIPKCRDQEKHSWVFFGALMTASTMREAVDSWKKMLIIFLSTEVRDVLEEGCHCPRDSYSVECVDIGNQNVEELTSVKKRYPFGRFFEAIQGPKEDTRIVTNPFYARTVLSA